MANKTKDQQNKNKKIFDNFKSIMIYVKGRSCMTSFIQNCVSGVPKYYKDSVQQERQQRNQRIPRNKRIQLLNYNFLVSHQTNIV